jgi:hypothetical protein
MPEPSVRLTGAPASHKGRKPCDNLLKLRAVLVLLSAPWGTKRKVSEDLSREFTRRGVKFSARALYEWREKYVCFGLAGLNRRSRNDRGTKRPMHREAISA